MGGKEGVVSFTVDGEGFTDLVRNMMLSDRPDSAWRIVSGGIMGEGSQEVARGVLEGTLKLINDSPSTLVAVEDEDSAEYKKQLRWLYAGRIQTNDGVWIRPIARIARIRVRSFSYFADPADDTYEVPLKATSDWDRLCASFFCCSGEIAMQIDGAWTLWEPCGNRPFWWTPNVTPREALHDAIDAGRKLDDIGGDIQPSTIKKNLLARENSPFDEPYNEIEEAYDEAKEAEHRCALAHIGKLVRERAGDDTFTMKIRADDRTVDALGGAIYPIPAREVRVPRAPFWNWALRRTKFADVTPMMWVQVSASGLKMPIDDPYHTDWMLGAGLDLERDHLIGSVASEAAELERYRLQKRLGDFEFTVLVDNGSVTGTIGEEIVVVPDLSVDHVDKVTNARAVITAKGGALAHIALLGTERGVTIVRDPAALTRWPVGTVITIDPHSGTIFKHSEPKRDP